MALYLLLMAAVEDLFQKKKNRNLEAYANRNRGHPEERESRRMHRTSVRG